jgi:carboxypeptidase C (cathepsin A)
MRSAVDEQLQGLRDDDGGGVGADWCANPVKKGKVVFPEPLVGRAQVDFEMYAGYVNVTQADYLYYWYFSAIDQNPNAPLVIWTNGGPGCSSMEGATTENGPLSLFDIKESCEEGGRGADQTCDYTGQLSSNQYAWNNHAHVVYVDQPRFVGNSGGGKGSQGVHSSVDAAQDFVTFYKGLMEIFPEFADKELIIAGESYGGHYIPAFSQALLDENSKNGGSIPFSGAVIGNGCVNDTVQNGDRYVDFAHAQNLIPEGSDPHGQAAASAEMEKFLGYTPNYYDYRLQSIPCRGCFGYDYNAWSHWFIQVIRAYMHTYICTYITTTTDSPSHTHTHVYI